MSSFLARKSRYLNNVLNFNLILPASSPKRLTTDNSKAIDKKKPEVPKLEDLKIKNPFFAKYESKLKEVYE